uniref:Uncharacterized protein n=1 Tax=Aegilops tauschii subsp. strangulata TaxID=200361 RepID=A0A453LXU3_AEGTS
RCCCWGCVLGGCCCPSPTSPTSGVRHELRAGPLLHCPGGDPGLGNPQIPIRPPSPAPLSLPLVANIHMLPLFIWLHHGVLSAENCFCIFYSSTMAEAVTSLVGCTS